MNVLFLIVATVWLAVPNAPEADEATQKGRLAAPGTSWFVGKMTNAAEVRSARWTVTALGVFEAYVNGKRVGNDFLKPGNAHALCTRYSFTYDVTSLMKLANGAGNAFAAEVSAGWWRDGVSRYAGKRSAFRGELTVEYADGSRKVFGTDPDTWTCAIAGAVKSAAIYDGEVYDARIAQPYFGGIGFVCPDVSDEFKGEVLPSAGAEVVLREDLALTPCAAYCWKGTEGADEANGIFGKVVKTRVFSSGEPITVDPGETLVVDFGQNCSAVPDFVFSAVRDAAVHVRFAEMLNEGNGAKSRGNDGPEGSAYIANLRLKDAMKLDYIFGGKGESVGFMPRHTFYGYRYLSLTTTSRLVISKIRSIPVTSITKEMEIGHIETGRNDVNRLIANVYWGQLSNYLSVPTDCPQRNERLGWLADTQVFTEAGAFVADTQSFFRKWMRDLRDGQAPSGGVPVIAPWVSGKTDSSNLRIGWSDAAVIVPYRVWRQFGDRRIVEENFETMERYLDLVAKTEYQHENTAAYGGWFQYADWLSFEPYESRDGNIWVVPKKVAKPEVLGYWDFLGACYWCIDSEMMAAMCRAVGKDDSKYVAMAERARTLIRRKFFSSPDGMIVDYLRGMQTPALFALECRILDGEAKDRTISALRENFRDYGNCLQTGFLGTSIIMDVLTANGMSDVAWDLLLQHEFPSWLYSVDQGATTIWERWNGYTKKDGFGRVEMNSFNHYAYGAVLAWIYKTVAGISSDENRPGFDNVLMRPVPDRRLGFVKAEYKTRHGMVKSAWRYEGDEWIWEFSVPEGSTATVQIPGWCNSREYAAGDYRIVEKFAK